MFWCITAFPWSLFSGLISPSSLAAEQDLLSKGCHKLQITDWTQWCWKVKPNVSNEGGFCSLPKMINIKIKPWQCWNNALWKARSQAGLSVCVCVCVLLIVWSDALIQFRWRCRKPLQSNPNTGSFHSGDSAITLTHWSYTRLTQQQHGLYVVITSEMNVTQIQMKLKKCIEAFPVTSSTYNT